MRRVMVVVLAAVVVASFPAPERAVASARAGVGPAVAAVPARSAAARPEPLASWRFTHTATTNQLRTVDVVTRSVIWAVGGIPGANNGSVVRTVDGGRSWTLVTPPGGIAEVFRDVEAFDRDRAVVLATGPGEQSRIYRTVDGGATWELVFQNPGPAGFYDCLAFFDHRRGLAVSDPVNGKFRIISTDDGGRSWQVVPDRGMPPAASDETALATGTCLVTAGPRDAWFGTATVPGFNSRVFHTNDGGRTWAVAATPIPGRTPVSGVASLSFRDRRHGIAVGGFAPPPGADLSFTAVTMDAGRSWPAAESPAGFRSGVAWIPGHKHTAVAVGPTGSDITIDDAQTWRLIDHTALWGIDCQQGGACWAVGDNGIAAQLTILGR